jgi:uncharacterized protein (TIGR03083 family)
VARHERDALGRTIQYTPPERWDEPSASDGWRNRDVVAHLAGADVAAAARVAGEPPTEWDEYHKAATDEGLPISLDGLNAFMVARRAELPFRQVAMEWGQAADLLLSRVSAIPEDEWKARRIEWVVGEIPVRFMLQSRVSEWYLHGEDIRAGGGLPVRIEHPPLWSVNDLAIRMLPYALGRAGLDRSDRVVGVDLEGAGGGRWVHGLGPTAPDSDARPDVWIEGRAYPFAMVAARRVPADYYLDDGTLVMSGNEDLGYEVLDHIRAFG